MTTAATESTSVVLGAVEPPAASGPTRPIRDFLFVGAFVVASVLAMFGWISAIGWCLLRLAEGFFE